jgi:hypothetical protein
MVHVIHLVGKNIAPFIIHHSTLRAIHLVGKKLAHRLLK